MLKKIFILPLTITVFFSMTNVYSADLRVVVLDVGTGQSVLLEDNGHGLLIDTGLAEYSPRVLSRMEYHGVNTLDYLVLSHFHPDHAAGYSHIREAWPDTPILGNCYLPEKLHPDEENFFWSTHATLSGDRLYGCLAAGDSLPWQSYEIQVLWGGTDPQKTLNYNSLVLLLQTEQGGSLLIMGDVDSSVEKSLTPVLQSLLRSSGSGVTLYVASHHGSAAGTEPEFLDVVRPQVSMVSVGKNNPYGYPSDSSLRILDKYSGTVLQTDRDGEICFTLGSTATASCTDR